MKHLLLVTALLALATQASAAIHSAAPGTLRQALAQARPGDTVQLQGGTYAEGIDSNTQAVPAGTSWSTPVTIAAAPGATVILRPGRGGEVINLASSAVQYLIFDGIVVDASGAGFGISLTGGASHIRFQNGEVRNAARSGIINSAQGSVDHQFVKLRIHHNGTDHYDHGLYIQTSYNLLEGNEIYSNSGYGVHIFNSYAGERASHNVVRNNRIYANSTRSTSYGGATINSGDGNQFYNNLVYNNPRGMDVLWGNPTNTQIYHNTFYNNATSAGVEIAGSASGTVFQNNILYKNGTGVLVAAGNQASANFEGDPHFANEAVGDFHLQPGSPAIDAGVVLAAVPVDFDGTPRPQGATADQGAYEHANGPVVFVPPPLPPEEPPPSPVTPIPLPVPIPTTPPPKEEEGGETNLSTLVNVNCVTWRITGVCACNPTTPCVQVEYWEPGWLIETVKIPGTTALAMAAPLMQSVFDALGVPPFGGGGASNATGSGQTKLQYNEAHVMTFPQLLGGPCTSCSSGGANFTLHYASEIDPLWRTATGLPALTDFLPGLSMLGVWANLYPRGGKAIHGSEPVGSGIGAARAMDISYNPYGTATSPEVRVVLQQTDANSRCCQLASPRQTPCFPVGTNPARWETRTVSRDGTYIWIFWRKRSCCVNPNQASCGMTLLGGYGANWCDTDPQQQLSTSR